MKQNRLLYIAIGASLLLTACTDDHDWPMGEEEAVVATTDRVIQVGGVETIGLEDIAAITRTETIDEETVTKTDAENISWLRGPLFSGLDITYGLSDNRSGTSRVAILKLVPDTGGENGISYSVDGDKKYANYTFKYRDNTLGTPTDDPAIWHGNGAHFFEGLYTPANIQYDASANPAETIEKVAERAPNLTTDQHGDNDNISQGALGNYTLLSRYLGMPSNYTINATVGRIKLPFRHRLARVLAYILIDPDVGEGVTIEGYKSGAGCEEDPSTSKIRFCNVKVLQGVKASYDNATKHYTYTPQWTEVRKAIPHFVGERTSYNDSLNVVKDATAFYSYYHIEDKRYIYPDDSEWETVHAKTFTKAENGDTISTDNKYKRTYYGKVPVYDMIVQPTYTTLANVMYDEEGVSDATTKQNLWKATNKIDFELTLTNGLKYAKSFVFDLDANYQTVVYLHIQRERVDYNSSGSELWVETRKDDDYYGVNNQNGNTLSLAGSSWQRAYTNVSGDKNANTGTKIGNSDLKITDGHYYQQDPEDRYAQYVDDNTWIEMLREAKEGGKHHGDYFILSKDISIPAAAFGDDFEFTGHLDGQDHTITLTNASYTAAHYAAYDDSSCTKYIQSGSDYVEFTPDANTTYYDNSGNYAEITDMDAYSGATIYTRSIGSYTYNIVPVGTTYDTTANYYYSKSGDTYSPIPDINNYLSAFNNNIYTKNADSYTAVASPTTENPKEQGWYEKNGETYSLSTDTVVSSEKTYYTKNADSYTAVSDVTTLVANGTYYKKTGDTYEQIEDINNHIGVYSQTINYIYTGIDLYKFVAAEIGSSTGTPTDGFLFAGLNGKYATAQETNESNTWEANVHKESRNNKPYWVPYKTNTDGWRAEVINLKVTGGTLFKSGATVTGYVHNCWEGSTKVTEYTPEIPTY